MVFYKLRFTFQRSLFLVLSLTKKSNSSRKINQIVCSNLNKVISACYFFVFDPKSILVVLKKNYFFQLISTNVINHFFTHKNVFLLFEMVKNDRNMAFTILNLPYSFSLVIKDLFDSSRKKTILLYRLLLVSSIPFLLFYTNHTFDSPKKNILLLNLLPENKKFISSIHKDQIEKSFFSMQDERKKDLYKYVFSFFFKKKMKINTTRTSFYLLLNQLLPSSQNLANTSEEGSLFFKPSYSTQMNKGSFLSQSYQNQQRTISSRWLFRYIKIKKDYSSSFVNKINQNHVNFQEKRLYKNPLGKINRSVGKFFDFFSLDLLEDRNSQTFSAKNDKKSSCSHQENRKSDQEINIALNRKSIQMRSVREWVEFVSEWTQLHPTYAAINSFSLNKQYIQDNFSLFKNREFLAHSLKKNFFLLDPLGSIFLKGYRENRIKLFSNKEPVILLPYKDTLQLLSSSSEPCNNLSIDKLLGNLNSNDEYRTIFPSRKEAVRSVRNKINVLYTSFVDAHKNKYKPSIKLDTLSVFPNPTKSVVTASENQRKNLSQERLEDVYLYDLDFCLPNKNVNSKIFLLPNFLFEETSVNQRSENQLADSAQTTNLPCLQEDLAIIKKRRVTLPSRMHLLESKLHKTYNNWLFTSQWWLLWKNGILLKSQSLVESVTTVLRISLERSFRKVLSRKNESYFFPRKSTKISNIFPTYFEQWNNLVIERVHNSGEKKAFWVEIELLKPLKKINWVVGSWFFAGSLFYYHWIPMFLGLVYIPLWLDFERVRSLSYPSQNTFLSILSPSGLDLPPQQLKLVSYLSRVRIFLVYSRLYTIWNNFFLFFTTSHYPTTLDFSRREKNLVSNSCITKKVLQPEKSFWYLGKEKYNFLNNTNESRNGFHFFQKWSEGSHIVSTPLSRSVFKPLVVNWLSNLYLFNKTLAYAPTMPFERTLKAWPSKPRSTVEPIAYAQRWLLIGSGGSGKSYIIKNLAATNCSPLIHMSIKEIQNATPYRKYTNLRKEKRWIEQLSERSFFLESVFNLGKMLAPSIFWISDLHEFEKKHQMQETTKKINISFLMTGLLKILSFDLAPGVQKRLIFIGSTEYPRLLDPKFVSRQRLDLIVNFRAPSLNQRKNIFMSLLKNQGFAIKGLRSFYELDSSTLGYTFRDVTGLTNEVLLVKTNENNSFIDRNTIRLSLYRQTFPQSGIDKTSTEENLQYKIGKALVQTLIRYPKSRIILTSCHDVWRTRFYYLANTFLEISNKKLLATEFVLLNQILNCLAGSAARDAWIFSSKDFPTSVQISLSLNSQLRHDLSIASQVLQSLLVEFPMQSIISSCVQKQNGHKNLLKRLDLASLRSAISSFGSLNSQQSTSYASWSLKVNRLSFNWLLFFQGLEDCTRNLTRFLNSEKTKSTLYSTTFSKSGDLSSPYERRKSKPHQQKAEELDSFFAELVSSLYIEELGFPWESNYGMSYNSLHSSLFLIEGRPIWKNPQALMPCFFVLLFDRDLVINKNFLTKLYITYGNKFQVEKLSKERIRKHTFTSSQLLSDRAYSLDFCFYQNLVNLSAQLDQSQINLPSCLHQGWITTDPNDSDQVFNPVDIKIKTSNEYLVDRESSLFQTLLESYYYLVRFFIANKTLMLQLRELLLKKEILYRPEIESAIKDNIKGLDLYN